MRDAEVEVLEDLVEQRQRRLVLDVVLAQILDRPGSRDHRLPFDVVDVE